MRKIVHDEINDVKVVYPNMINKVKKDFVAHTVKQEKNFRMVYEKSKIMSNFDTPPCEYKN